VDILVIPAAYGRKPSIRENYELAKTRTRTVRKDCTKAVAGSGLTCMVRLVRTFTRGDAKRPNLVARIEDPQLDGLYFLGGNQVYAMNILAGSPAEDAMADAYARGVVVGGTSAGDMVESATMIAGYNPGFDAPTGMQEGAPKIWWSNDVHHQQRGLSFGSKAGVFDSHFYERGRLPRLLNVTAQSAERFGGAGLLGFGFDYGTGARVEDDRLLTGTFGSSSLAVVDLGTAGATHSWAGAERTLSERDALTHIVAPGDGVTFDLASRIAKVDGAPVRYRSPGPWPNGVLRAPGAGTLMLAGDLSRPRPSAATTRFVQLANASGRSRIVVLTAAYAEEGSARRDAARYLANLRDAGWTGDLQRVLYPQNPLPSLTGVAGVLLAGGDASLLGTSLDPRLKAFVADALRSAPVVLTDQAMTQAFGGAYAANPNVPPSGIDAAAIHRFRAANARVRTGLGYLPGAMFVARLGEDERWGQLYGLTIERPGLLAFGIDEGTAIELPRGGPAVVVGQLSVVTVDGRSATAMVGSNGAFTDLNALLDTFAPGDRVAGTG
jgi:cyanophycinase-like exopeptidase